MPRHARMADWNEKKSEWKMEKNSPQGSVKRVSFFKRRYFTLKNLTKELKDSKSSSETPGAFVECQN